MTWSRSWSGKSGEIANALKGEMGVPDASREFIKANLPKDETSQFSASASGHDWNQTDGKQMGSSVSISFVRQDAVPVPEATSEPKPVESAAAPATDGNGEVKHAEVEKEGEPEVEKEGEKPADTADAA
jgi:hypothetical protein